MKRCTKLFLRNLMVFVLAFVLVVPVTVPQTIYAEEETTSSYALEDNYYQWKNAEVVASKTVPAGELSWTNFTDLGLEGDAKIQQLVDELITNKSSYSTDSDEYQIAEIYEQFLDSDARNAAGIKAIQPYLKKIKKANTVKKYVKALRAIEKEVGYGSLFGVSYTIDSEDVTKYVGYIRSSDLVLTKDMYENAEYAAVQKGLKTYIAQMLQYAGTTKKQSQKDAKQVYKIMKKIASKSLSIEDWYDQAKTNRYMTAKQLKKNYPNMDLVTTAKNYGIASYVSKYQVAEQDALDYINSILTKKNLNALKQYSTFVLVKDTSGFLTTEMEDQTREFSNQITGVSGRTVRTGEAISFVNGYYGEQIGQLYVKKYVSDDAKADIQSMVEELIAAYKERLQKADWLTESTRTNAIKKLDTMKLNLIAPPESYVPHYQYKLISKAQGGVLADNLIRLYQYLQKESLAAIKEPVDLSGWQGVPPQTVNAFYSPIENSITFPAAIFDGVFYDPERSREENLGAIGVVIGHEISHAFDTNGSQYDENGNLKDWWTQEDKTAFQEKANKVIQAYDSAKTASGVSGNGSLTITENIADLGGVAVASSLVGDDQEKLQRFFESYANMWACKYASEDAQRYYSTVDVHALAELRVNVVISNIDSFYKAYPQITSGNAMYVAPEERCAIW